MAQPKSMRVGNGTSVADAVKRWRKKTLVSNTPAALTGLVICVIVWRLWRPGGGWGQLAAAGLGVLFLSDSVRCAWIERRDPALATFSGGVLRFYWISGQAVDASLPRVRWAKVHENHYWNIRRGYPKWFEVEIEGEPKRIIVPDSNLKPEARELLTRMSGSAQ